MQEHSPETRNHSHFWLKSITASLELFQTDLSWVTSGRWSLLGVSTLPVPSKDSVALVLHTALVLHHFWPIFRSRTTRLHGEPCCNRQDELRSQQAASPPPAPFSTANTSNLVPSSSSCTSRNGNTHHQRHVRRAMTRWATKRPYSNLWLLVKNY